MQQPVKHLKREWTHRSAPLPRYDVFYTTPESVMRGNVKDMQEYRFEESIYLYT